MIYDIWYMSHTQLKPFYRSFFRNSFFYWLLISYMWTVPGQNLVSFGAQKRLQIGAYSKWGRYQNLVKKRQEICKNEINDQQVYSLLILIPPMEAASQAEDTALFPSAGTAADPLRSPKALKWRAFQRWWCPSRWRPVSGVGHSVTATLGRDGAGILPRNREVLVYMWCL